MLDTLIAWDKAATLWINSHYSPFWDQVWMFLSSIKVWFPLYAAIVFMFFKRLGWRRGLVALISIAITTLLCDQGANLVKNSVCRLRPCYDLDMISGGLHMLEKRGHHFGFFSAHASNAFGIAVCSLMCFRMDKSHTYKTYAILAPVWASLIAISRIFAGKHYLGDVLVGTVVGLIIGYLVGLAAVKITGKLWPSPSLYRGSL